MNPGSTDRRNFPRHAAVAVAAGSLGSAPGCGRSPDRARSLTPFSQLTTRCVKHALVASERGLCGGLDESALCSRPMRKIGLLYCLAGDVKSGVILEWSPTYHRSRRGLRGYLRVRVLAGRFGFQVSVFSSVPPHPDPLPEGEGDFSDSLLAPLGSPYSPPLLVAPVSASGRAGAEKCPPQARNSPTAEGINRMSVWHDRNVVIEGYRQWRRQTVGTPRLHRGIPWQARRLVPSQAGYSAQISSAMAQDWRTPGSGPAADRRPFPARPQCRFPGCPAG